MTITRTFTTVTAVAITAVAALSAPGGAYAASSAKQAKDVRVACAASTYVKERPDAIPVGSVHRGETLELGGRSTSGKWAHTVVRRPKFTTKGWVKVSDLCAKGEAPEWMRTSRYSVRIANSPAGGDPGFLYVGGPANITARDAERAGQKVTVCVTPAPVERSSCRTGRTGQTIDTIVWSKDGPTEVRIAIEGVPVLVDTIYPYGMPVVGAPR